MPTCKRLMEDGGDFVRLVLNDNDGKSMLGTAEKLNNMVQKAIEDGGSSEVDLCMRRLVEMAQSAAMGCDVGRVEVAYSSCGKKV